MSVNYALKSMVDSTLDTTVDLTSGLTGHLTVCSTVDATLRPQCMESLGESSLWQERCIAYSSFREKCRTNVDGLESQS
jgi:hypothetical protein